MHFLSWSFYSFFIITFIALSMSPPHLKKWPLMLASLVYAYSWGPKTFVYLTITFAVTYVLTYLSQQAGRLLFKYIIHFTFFLFVMIIFFLIRSMNLEVDFYLPWQTHLALPVVGFSFYALKAISYYLDNANKNTKLSSVNFWNYLSYFPQLASGPIDRFNKFQQNSQKVGNLNAEVIIFALLIFSWGAFKKLVIANNLELQTSQIFNTPTDFHSLILIGNLVFYTIQIYCDFSGYIDMAVGISLAMGISMPPNFNSPYMSRNLLDFWSRWHITLGEWLRDYVFYNLSLKRNFPIVVSTLVVFILSGLWHGFGLNFMLWGIYHALGVISYLLLPQRVKPYLLKKPYVFFNSFFTFLYISIGWALFRLTTPQKTLEYLIHMLTKLNSGMAEIEFSNQKLTTLLITLIFFYVKRFSPLILQVKKKNQWVYNYLAIIILVLATVLLGNFKVMPFIYAQF